MAKWGSLGGPARSFAGLLPSHCSSPGAGGTGQSWQGQGTDVYTRKSKVWGAGPDLS